jgi:hypothetical protein
MTSVRKLNAAAASAVSLAIRAGCDTRRGSDELVLENAIATCEKALAWGFTGAVLCRAAEAHLELSKVLSLRGEDQACLQSLLKAQQWLEEIEYTYEGYDHVKILKLELELDMARALANLGRKTQAKTKLKMIRNELPRQGRLREALEEQQSRLMDQNEQIDGPVRRSSVEAAPDRKIRLSVWRKAREEQQRQELLKRLREKEHSDDDDDEVEFVGQRSRADFIGAPDASGAGFGGAATQMQPAPDAFGVAFSGAPTQMQPAPDAFGAAFGGAPTQMQPAPDALGLVTAIAHVIAGVQHKDPEKDKGRTSLAAKVGLIKNEFGLDQKMPMHQVLSAAEAELGFQACDEQSMLHRVEQVLKAAGL